MVYRIDDYQIYNLANSQFVEFTKVTAARVPNLNCMF